MKFQREKHPPPQSANISGCECLSCASVTVAAAAHLDTSADGGVAPADAAGTSAAVSGCNFTAGGTTAGNMPGGLFVTGFQLVDVLGCRFTQNSGLLRRLRGV